MRCGGSPRCSTWRWASLPALDMGRARMPIPQYGEFNFWKSLTQRQAPNKNPGNFDETRILQTFIETFTA